MVEVRRAAALMFMQRRRFFRNLLGLVVMPFGAGASLWAGRRAPRVPSQQSQPIEKLIKPKSEWRKLLTPDRYRVLFEEATEPSFTSPLNAEKRRGTYLCAACFLPLFDSRTKFESGTGWPSFYQPIAGRVGTKTDFKLIYPRTEYHCIRCGGHQGHVFDDGPPPTGQRWCNNGVALGFIPA